MKKNYQKPESAIIPILTQKPLLTGSTEEMTTVTGSWDEEKED